MDTKIRVTDKPHQSKTLKTGLATALLVALMALTACAPMTPVPAPDAVMQATPAPAEEVAATPAPTEAAVTEPAGAFGDAWEPVSCDTFTLPKDVAESSDCGYVTVPELHEDPDGRAIKLAVVRIHSTGEKPAPDPLFMEQGGPGGSTIHAFANLAAVKKFLPLLASRDVVLVEQRGTKYSIPNLEMPEEVAHDVAVLKGQVAKDDYSYIETFKGRVAKDANLSAYNTQQNAADMVAVAKALGYEQFNYYGTSYATLLGQYVMNQAADHPGMLRSVILDGVVPIDLDDDAAKDGMASSAMRSFFAACANDAVCNRDFPDLESKVLAAADRLNAEPAQITVTLPDDEKVKTSFSGSDLMRLIFLNLYSTSKIQGLPGNLDALVNRGDYSWAEAGRSEDFGPSAMAGGMHLGVKCARFPNFPGQPQDLVPPAYPQVNIAGPEMDSYTRRCELLDVAGAGPDEYVNSTAAIPTLILNGAFDPATPVALGEYVGSKLKTSYVFTMPDAGHSVLLSSPSGCPATIALQFLQDPTQAPDGSCIDGLKPTFLGRVVPVEELTLAERAVAEGVTAAIPSQWAGSGGTFRDPNDPYKAATGMLEFTVEKAESPEAKLKSMDPGAKLIASDQALGAYRWTTVESSRVPGKSTLIGAALLPNGKDVVVVKLYRPVGNNDAIDAKLWEPVLSSVKVK